MADRSQERVYCHECRYEWQKSTFGLVCPQCESDFTQVMEHGDDPRQGHVDNTVYPGVARSDHGGTGNGYDPWGRYAPDPDEDDIEDHMNHGEEPAGHVHYTSVTFRSRSPMGGQTDFRPDAPVMGDFARMLVGIMGQEQHQSSHHDPRPHPPGFPGSAHPGMRPFAARPPPPTGMPHPPGHFPGQAGTTSWVPYASYSRTRLHPRDANNAQPPAEPVSDITGMMQRLMSYTPRTEPDSPQQSEVMMMPLEGGNPFMGMFASLLNPAAAASGDAVYTQEALDRVVSQMMEQNTLSNAPGPASASALASLPTKRVDASMLGEEGKADCSICMDEVPLGHEVVHLPCSHWFHEHCAKEWLREHDTCPICRQSITSPSSGDGGGRRRGGTGTSGGGRTRHGNSRGDSNNSSRSNSSSSTRHANHRQRFADPWQTGPDIRTPGAYDTSSSSSGNANERSEDLVYNSGARPTSNNNNWPGPPPLIAANGRREYPRNYHHRASSSTESSSPTFGERMRGWLTGGAGGGGGGGGGSSTGSSSGRPRGDGGYRPR
ncbi:MAG: hypothetical protein M1825_005630 [Sarcosagium campestre]|nr:MAG: hypothetical protein M1825_005630 [Sarcosagium campestre]